MTRCLLVVILASACGGDDDSGEGLKPCDLTLGGDAAATSQCRM